MSCHRTIIRLSAVLAVVASAEGCGDGDSATAPPTPEPARPTTVTVSPATNELTALGATVQLSAEVHDQNARVMAGATMTWTSSASSVATVNASGLVTAAGNGTATITSSAGSASGSAVVTVMQSVVSVEVSPSSETIASGSTLQLTAEAFDENGNAVAGAEFSWESSDAAVATVDASGLVTAVAKGVVTITASAGNAQGTAEITVGPDPDRAALVALYEATDGPNWTNNDNWLTDVPLRDWYGVRTNASGRVVGIGLAGRWDNEAREWIPHGLAGPIPSELGNLTNLEGLWLNANTLTGEIPPELGGLTNLTNLNLTANELGGAIPAELGSLANLQHLELGSNALSGPIPSELGNLTNLEGLWLNANRLTGEIPPELGGLTNLTNLNLTANELGGPIPAELGSLANLQHLELGSNALSGPIPSELGNLTNLEGLWLSGNRLTGEIPPELGSLTNVINLVLTANELGGPIPAELGNLTDLEVLWLNRNRLTGEIPPELGSLTNVINLVLTANELGGPIPAELGNLTNLRYLHLNENQLGGLVPPELGELANLILLNLAWNYLSGALPPTFTGLTSLERLILDETELCMPQTTEFELWLQGVRMVQGEKCAIVQEGGREALAAIYKWTNGDGWKNKENWLGDGPLDGWYGVTADSKDRVTALDLADNNLAGILPAEAGSLLHLEDLVLTGNSTLGGHLPGRMLQLTSLSTLRLDGTGLCVPGVFQHWLNRIADARVTVCPDDHGNDASGATRVAVGERAEGELESYQDEDWFRVEIRGRGTLTAVAEGNTSVQVELYDETELLLGYEGAGANLPVSTRLTPGTYYVRAAGTTDETRGPYVLATSFEPRRPGVRAYLTQAVQSHDFAVPLVAGEDALLRVFVMADDGVTASMPPVRATFYRGGQAVHSAWIEGMSQHVPSTMAEGDLDATANAVVPGSVLVPGTEMVVDVDPDGTLDPSLGIGGRLPEEGRMALNIRSMPDFDVTAVPFLWTENPDSSGYKATIGLTADHDVFYETRDWLPVAAMEVTVREPVQVDYDPKENMERVLDDTELLRVVDGASGHYMGVPPWIDGGILGIARLGGKSSVSRLDGHTVAHEFGHNFSLRHTPCGDPAGVDGRYPHSGGKIGAWGYDFLNGELVDPEVYTDLMTYCRTNDWISDYSFAKAVEYRGETQAMMASRVVQQVLLVRGGVAGGELRIEPAFVLDAPPTLPESAGPYRLMGSDQQGGELFSLRFEMQEVTDVEVEGDGGFTFAIPVRTEWAETLATLTLTGPEGTVTLTGDDDPAAPATALVLDVATGRIRAIMRDPPVQTVVADRSSFALPGTVTLFSRGIPGTEAWRR